MPEQGSQLQNIGNALAGFSAGINGQLPQFMQQQQESRMLQEQQAMQQQQRQQQAAIERQKTMFVDAQAALQFAEKGDYENVVNLGMMRLDLLQNFPDADPSDTRRVTQLALAARNGSREAADLLKAELTNAVEIGRSIGVLETPKPAQGATDQGKLQQDLNAGLITQEQYDKLSAAQPTNEFRTLEARAQAAGLTAGTPEYQSFMAQGGRPEQAPNMREREARIQEYMSNFGLSRPEAISRLDAQYMTDPVSGNLISVDRATGSGSVADVGTGEPPAAMPAPPPVDLSQLSFDPGKGTGAGAAFIGLYNSSLGQLPFLPTIMGAETAAQQLTILERDAIKALASSTRPAVVEQERILQAIPKAMEWSQNPNIARSKMISFVDLMTNQYIDDLRYAKDLSQPKGIREESGRRAREIESIFRRVMQPEAAAAMLDSINGVEAATDRINSMSFDQLESIQLENLSDAELDIYMERLRSGR